MAKRIWISALLVTACAFLAPAQPFEPQAETQVTNASPSWLDQLWELPVLRFFARPSFSRLTFSDPLPVLSQRVPPPPPCLVDPLPAIEDSDALQFEAASGTSAVVDVEGLTPAMSAALHRFVQTVASVGGEMELKSAYRPPSYQAHLQTVWDKWREVRNNRDPNCSVLRASVQMEFERHRLLESQRPVTFSDHTRGNAFDAAVFLPARARLARRPVTLDKLARLSGVQRPDIARDPVHFRLIGAPSARSKFDAD